ncbi:hypothetical protein LguiB_028062 [Lonicera macranthoides]
MFVITTLVLLTIILLLILPLVHYGTKPSHKIFLLDFACYKPSASLMCTREKAADQITNYANLSKETSDFVKKIINAGGLGDSTYVPESLLTETPNPCMKNARRETEMAMFGSIDALLEKACVNCKDIRILVVNCCIFNVVPSLCSMVINRYKLKEDVISYNLTGMGCSAGLVAIGLAKQLLQVHPNAYALVVSTENITENEYKGQDHQMLLINCLFRLGGAAILLSNRLSDCYSSKYQLIHSVQTHTASSDLSYNCIRREEDEVGRTGVTITKDLLVAANRAIESNITTLGSLILPLSEKVRFTANNIIRKLHFGRIQPYLPKFKKAIDHFFSHVGGKPVLDDLQRNLGFLDEDMEPSRMALHRFGNTSSSSVWYALAYAEAKGRIKKGDRVWQIAFGSGFKCSSAFWHAMRNIDYEETNPWTAEIDGFPVNLDNLIGSSPFLLEPSKQT